MSSREQQGFQLDMDQPRGRLPALPIERIFFFLQGTNQQGSFREVNVNKIFCRLEHSLKYPLAILLTCTDRSVESDRIHSASGDGDAMALAG